MRIRVLCVGMLAAVLAVPFVASAQPYERSGPERRDANLVGKWYSNGERDKPVDIRSSRRGLQARNEHGDTSRLETRGNNVRALDWEGGLRGHIKRDRIEWANGSTWTRTPSHRRRRLSRGLTVRLRLETSRPGFLTVGSIWLRLLWAVIVGIFWAALGTVLFRPYRKAPSAPSSPQFDQPTPLKDG